MSPDPTLSFPDDPQHTSARLEPVRALGERARDAAPPAPGSRGGLGRLVARLPDPREVDEEPTPIARQPDPPPPVDEGAATLLHQRPRARDHAEPNRDRSPPQPPEVPPEPERLQAEPPDEAHAGDPFELSDPGPYTLTDVDLPPIPRTLHDDDEGLAGSAGHETRPNTADRPRTSPSIPPLEDIAGYDEVFPLRSDPRLTLPAPPPARSNPDETNSLLESTGHRRKSEGPPGPAGPEPDEPGTQWEARPRVQAPPPGVSPLLQALGEENTDIRGFGVYPSFEEDDAPTVIMPPPPGLGDTPVGEQRAPEPYAQEVTAPANQATARLTRPDAAVTPAPPGNAQGWSAAALAASSLGVTLFVLVAGVGALLVLRSMGLW